MTQFKNFKTNPLTAHPLSDQQEWYADDLAIKTLEKIVNHKNGNPYATAYELPENVLEGGNPFPKSHGSLTQAAVRTKEGVRRV